MQPAASIPPICLLRHLNAVELHSLAHELASQHRRLISGLNEEEARAHAGMVHSYGISPAQNKRTSIAATLQRLSCPVFWRDKINAIADFARETNAARRGQLGSESLGLQPYCSDASLEIFMARQLNRFTNDDQSISRYLRMSANDIYLSSLALASTAFKRKYTSVFFTLTLPGSYHSSAKSYEGHSLADGHDRLSQLLSKLIARISRKGECGEDFFGIRSAEVNACGCPHWHVILYCKPVLVKVIQQQLEKLFSDLSPDSYENFIRNRDKVLQVRQAEDFSFYKQGISYVFKNSYAGRNSSSISVIDALRQKVALSMYRKTQYQLIGSKGRKTVFNNLRRFSKKPTGLPGVASELALKKGAKERKQRQLSAVIELFEGGAKQYQFIKKCRKNAYGDDVYSIVSVKHMKNVSPETGRHIAKPRIAVQGIMRNASRYSEYQIVFCTVQVESQAILSLEIRAPPNITDYSNSVDCLR